jgi:hypothetical protein
VEWNGVEWRKLVEESGLQWMALSGVEWRSAEWSVVDWSDVE